MNNGSRRAHGDSRPARTPSREGIPLYFFWILKEQYLLATYVTGFCSVAALYTLRGERPPVILRDVGRCVCTFSDSPGNVAIVVDFYVYGGS